MKDGEYRDNLLSISHGSTSSEQPEAQSSSEDDSDPNSKEASLSAKVDEPAKQQPRTFFGFDEDDEFLSSSDEEANDNE
jgi:hypothetical protein